jgi:hypothetical protein
MTETRMVETLGIEPYLVSSFCDSCFGFVSIFEIRASNFRSCCEPLVGGSLYFLLKESRSWIRLVGGIQKAEKYQRELPKSKRTHKERVTLSGKNDLPCRYPQHTLPSISGPGARFVPVAETLWWSVESLHR